MAEYIFDTHGDTEAGDVLVAVDILHHLKEMDSTGFYEATGSTYSRVPAGSCFRPLMRFDPQAIPVRPTVKMFFAAFTSAFSS